MEKIRIPIPDPLGILAAISKDGPVEFFDPLNLAKEMVEGREKEQEKDFSASYVEDKVDKYVGALEEALRYSPCPGCRTLVESALIGAEIYRRMEREGKKKEDISQEEVERIRKEIEGKYGQNM